MSSASSSHDAWIAAAKQVFVRHRSRVAAAPTIAAHSAIAVLDATGPLQEALPGYQFQSEINRGGQGVVYRALQLGTKRDVAVKVVRDRGVRQREAQARFDREVQILGQLRHPNIVTILDSGSAAGCLYYIMDFIPGASLEEHFRKNNTSLQGRIETFATICEALNLAHLRGVVHRDLKPSNIRIDAAGQPHLLDFGLARETELNELGEGAMRTQTGDFVGSLPWASPEQVERDPEQLDIRTDVYSLGVMLYHALTAQFPYETVGPLRTVMENISRFEPARPSRCNSALGAELDAIVLKCLRKAPDDRYQSAGDLGRDLRRYLAGEAIEAKSDSSWYLLRKAIRRNRGRAAIAGLLLAVAAYSAVLLAYWYREESRLRTVAENALRESNRQTQIAQAVNEFLNSDLLGSVSPEQMGRNVTVREVLDMASAKLHERFADQPAVKAELHHTLGSAYRGLGELAKSLEHFRLAYDVAREAYGENDEKSLVMLNKVAVLYQESGRLRECEALCRKLLSTYESLYGPEHPEAISATGNLGWILFLLDRSEEALGLLRRAQEAARRVHGAVHEQTQNWTNSLAAALRETGHLEEAMVLQRQALDMARQLHGEDHPDTLLALGNLAELYKAQGQYDASADLYRQVVAGRKRVLGEAHPRTLISMNNLAILYGRMRRDVDAAALFEEGLRLGPRQMDKEHSTLVSMRSNLAAIYDRLEYYDEAERLHREALQGAKSYLPAGHSLIGLYERRLGACLYFQRRFEAALPILQQAYEILERTEGAESENARDCARTIVHTLDTLGRHSEAMPWRACALD